MGDIALNINCGTSGDIKKKSKGSKPKKRPRPESSPSQDDDVAAEVTASASIKRQRMRPAEGDLKKKDWRQGSISSSLFHGNPEISAPRVSVTPAKSKHEKPALFSELTFDNVNLHPFMVSNLERILGSTTMTAVQQSAIPPLLTGQDALVRSDTGSGKTLAYCVPIVQMLQAERPKISRTDGTLALILVPTRELALQTYNCLIQLVKPFTWLVPGILCGGEKRKSEKARLRRGVTILACTPGRVRDHLVHTENCRLDKVRMLVIDEADRMLDMGYEKDVASIVESLGKTEVARQTILLSATLGPGVDRLAGLALRQPRALLDVEEGSAAESQEARPQHLSVPATLKQWAVVVPLKLRLVTLATFLAAKAAVDAKLLLFCATQDMVDYLAPLLEQGLSGTCKFFRLHGNMSQKDRTEVFLTFRDATHGVLLCTDVASRGLDLPLVDWIVQLNAPASPADYVHRVGRTARLGKKGDSLLFLAPSETTYLQTLAGQGLVVNEMSAEKILNKLRSVATSLDLEGDQVRSRRGPGISVEAVATQLQQRFESRVLEDQDLHGLACKAFTSFVRFYSSYPRDARHDFQLHALHLGHFAKSLALRDTPQAIGQQRFAGGRQQQHRSSAHKNSARGRSQHAGGRKTRPERDLILSEFASGL